MNTKTKFGMLIASVALAASGAVCAADAPANPYVQAAGQTLMTNFGLCVRTGSGVVTDLHHRMVTHRTKAAAANKVVLDV